MEQRRANHGPRFCLFLEKLVTPATIGPNAYLLDSVKNSFEIRNGEKSVDELGISAPNDKEFIVELKQAQPSFLAVVSIAWLAPQNQKFVEAQGKDYALDSEHLLYSGPFTQPIGMRLQILGH